MLELASMRTWSWMGLALLAVSAPVAGQIRITEYMYAGAGGEFVEFTNVGAAAIDMNGWSYSDEGEVPGAVDLSAFGIVQPGESVILAEAAEGAFVAAWGLSGVDVIGGNIVNLNRNDAIFLYDAGSRVVDQLDFGDQQFPGSIRANNISGWPCAQAVGANDPYGWILSALGDSQGTVASSNADLGSPGAYVSFVCAAGRTGACCQAGSCSITTQAECTGVGLYQGDGTDCTVACPAPSGAAVRITEFMYNGVGAEFVEFTNLEAVPVDMTGWSFSDATGAPGRVSLSGFGVLQPGESAILTDIPAEDFEIDWQLSGVTVIGGNTTNLGAADEIHLFDLSGALVDRIVYGAAAIPGSVDPDGRGAWPCESAIGNNQILEWRLSFVGDGQSSVTSLLGDIGSPGSFTEILCGPGSCCVSGNCSNLTAADCLLAHGLFLGDGTTCATHPCPTPSNAAVRITEFMYSGSGGEFLEITNLGSEPVDMSGWSFSDNAGLPGMFSLAGMGILQPGESAIVSEAPPAPFAADWGLSGVDILFLPGGGELGRNDEINIFDGSGSLVDALQYGDEDFPGSIATEGFSGWTCSDFVGQNDIFEWQLSAEGDAQGSVSSISGDIGSPGSYTAAPCAAECRTASDCCDQDSNGIRDDNCVWCACAAPACTTAEVDFADVGGSFGSCTPDGFTNLFDRTHVLTCFAGSSLCDELNVDVGGSFGSCLADGFCNLFDATHVLTTFAGTNACSCPAGPAPQNAPLAESAAALRIQPRQQRIRPGQVVEVDVVLEQPVSNLQSYQLHLQASGGRAGSLELTGIQFAPLGEAALPAGDPGYEAFSPHRAQMFRGRDAGGVAAPAGAYLATFTYRASADARGVFVVDALYDAAAGGQTFLVADYVQPMILSGSSPAIITLVDPFDGFGGAGRGRTQDSVQP